MLTGVEYVRKICEARKIPISQLEKDCKFSNGYLNPKKLQKIPYERAMTIAKYLGVGVEAILGIEEEKAPASDVDRAINDDDIKFALFGDAEIDDELYEEVKAFARFAKERKEKRST